MSDEEYGEGQIVPEDINEDDLFEEGRYGPGHWNYRARCADVELALADTRTRIEEWRREDDAHGWWHERPMLIALHNEVIRLRASQKTGDSNG
jgi:hypothetical protein